MIGADGAPRRPVVLIILDGFGANPSKLNNAVAIAETPNFDRYFASYPHTLLNASASASGLPDGQMGNSEVGHVTLGSGQVVRQDLVQICDAIADQSFFENEVLVRAAQAAAAADRPLHLVGLVSDGGVHSHVSHLMALIRLCRRQGAIPCLHMITDGRDTAPKRALVDLKSLQGKLADAGGHIATVMGRYYAMDRDNRWERTELAWRAMVEGRGDTAPDAATAIENSYAAGNNDEFILPTVLDGAAQVQADDQVVCFNFRRDRPRQIVASLFKTDFDEFDRGDFAAANVTCMTEYDQWFPLPYAFEQEKPSVTLAQHLCEAGLKQLHCAETEKFAHVTFFFNGGRGDAFDGEERCLIPSPDVATYDLKPEMSAPEVADTVIDAMQGREYAFIVVNFANGDMVGHTAVADAVVKAVEALDKEVGRVLDAAVDCGWSVIMTADHGNCDEMVDPITGEPQTQHTVYPVPCLIVDKKAWRLSVGGALKNVAPTVLQLMGLNRPDAMQSKSLLLGPVG